MNDKRTTSRPSDSDALLERHREAARLDDTARPAAGVRAAILEQAAAQAKLHPEGVGTPVVGDAHRPAANEGRWRLKAFASVMLVGLAGLLAWQVERAPEGEPPEAPAATATPPAPPSVAPVEPAPGPEQRREGAPKSPSIPARESQRRAEAAPQAAPQRKGTAPSEPAFTDQGKSEAGTASEAFPAAPRSQGSAKAAASAPVPADMSARRSSILRERNTELADAAEPRSMASRPQPHSARSLWQLAATGQAERLRQFKDSGTLDIRNEQGHTALLLAIDAADALAVRTLLEAGADPRLADGQGVTPLEHARRRGDAGIIELVEAAGARAGR